MRSKTAFLAAVGLLAPVLGGQTAPRQFTVKDDIEFAAFRGYADTDFVNWSPNREYVSVQVERGLVSRNRVEGELRIYSAESLRRFLSGPSSSQPPEPLVDIRETNYSEGPVIQSLHWLQDSSGLTFLARTNEGKFQAKLVDIRSRKTDALTPPTQHVIDIAIRDRRHFAYTVHEVGPKGHIDLTAPSFVGTGRTLTEIVLPPDPLTLASDRTELWAVQGGQPFLVKNAADHASIAIYLEGERHLALSPQGDWLVTIVPVPVIPPEWEKLYPPDIGAARQSRPQDLSSPRGGGFVGRYVAIQLETGKVFELTKGAPTARYGSWVASGAAQAAWSDDGRSIVLPGSYLPSSAKPAQPCLVVTDPHGDLAECVAPLGSFRTSNVGVVLKSCRFDVNRSDRLVVDYLLGGKRAAYLRVSPHTWTADTPTPSAVPSSVNLTVKQGLNEPPVLMATDTATNRSGAVWDPNPQLKQIHLGEAAIYRWKDHSGRDAIGGLYKPVDYVSGRRYPLVIQTHGFYEDRFIPSGIFNTAFAAREFAAAGVVVLQVKDCSIRLTPEEGPCQVAGYESAVEKLAAEGLVDPDRVGIIGFSRTCYYTMEALTMSKFRFKAASITDGTDGGYWQYVAYDEESHRDHESVNGAAPFGEGLPQWLHRAPGFNLDRVSAPLLVVSSGLRGVIEMWEPYSMLRALKKPVDLIVINSEGHPYTNPAARLASQGGSVDWFRFWLLDEIDPDPAKAEQYRRWNTLRSHEQK